LKETKELTPILKIKNNDSTVQRSQNKSAKKVTLADLRSAKYKPGKNNGYHSNGEDEDMPYISDNY
jgi:hypothetical protein